MALNSTYKLVIFRPSLKQGGGDRVTLTLLEHLDRSLFNITLVLMQKEGVWLDDVPGDVRVVFLGASHLVASLSPLAIFLKQNQPDIFFSTSSGANLPAVLAARWAGFRGRLVLSERGRLYRKGRMTPRRHLAIWLKRLFYRYADAIAVVSQGVKDELVTQLNISEAHVTVVYNPIVTSTLPILAAEPVVHPWFAESNPVLLSVGRFVPEKDYPTLIEALALLRLQQPVRLIMLGEGPLLDEIKALVKAKELTKDVCFMGFDKNPYKYMSRCTIFVLSSRNEGLPGALIQAMACGAVVVSTDCPSGPSEIIDDGETGFLVPVGDARQMADRIAYVLNNPTKRSAIARTASKSTKRFHVNRIIENYENVLRPPEKRLKARGD